MFVATCTNNRCRGKGQGEERGWKARVAGLLLVKIIPSNFALLLQ